MSKAKKKAIDFTEDRLFPLGWGLIYKTVCAPKSWSPEKVGDVASAEDPPGTSMNRWIVSDPHERKDIFNNTNCLPCPDCEHRQHWLINC